MTRKTKARLFFGLLIAMVTYILWSFYISEPKYVNNANNHQIETYDWISIPEYQYSFEDTSNQSVKNGIVLQTDGKKALVKVQSRYFGGSDEMKEVDITAHHYRIIGKGTIYHRVNNWVGFNIMFITQLMIGVVFAILVMTQSKLLTDLI